jgi:uncharacterized protein YprB with RNaseH-like and TPR domain
VLTHTFLHIRGVGRQLERILWDAGVTSWEQLKAFGGRIPGIGRKKRAAILDGIRLSERRLAAGDARYFHERLPASERFRIAHDFKDRLAFLDIETTGMGPRAVTTLVGVRAGGEARLFLRGLDLDEFPAFPEGHDVWVTYNGACFDEPFLRGEFGERVRPAAHIDIRWCLRPVLEGGELGGGLKGVERAVGIERPGHLAGLDGWDAVRLWGEYQAGRVASLRTLVEYNLEDVANLEPLLAHAVRRNVEKRGLPMGHLEAASTAASREKAMREAVARLGRLTGHW